MPHSIFRVHRSFPSQKLGVEQGLARLKSVEIAPFSRPRRKDFEARLFLVMMDWSNKLELRSLE